MIVWCQNCEAVPLDTACNERLVCMPCGVQQDFDSHYEYREYNDRLDEVGPYEYQEYFAPPETTPMTRYISLLQEELAESWKIIDPEWWSWKITIGDAEDHIIRSEN